MQKRSYYGLLPWPVALAIFWTYLWRSTLLTISAMTLIESVVRLMYGHWLADNTNQLLLAVVSLPTWLLSLKWAIEKHWAKLSAVEETDRKVRQKIAESQH